MFTFASWPSYLFLVVVVGGDGGIVRGATLPSDNSVRRRSDGPQVHVVLQKVLLQLGKDVFTVGVLSERGHVRSDFVHEELPLGWLRHIDHLLNHIICILQHKTATVNSFLHSTGNKSKRIPLVSNSLDLSSWCGEGCEGWRRWSWSPRQSGWPARNGWRARRTSPPRSKRTCVGTASTPSPSRPSRSSIYPPASRALH